MDVTVACPDLARALDLARSVTPTNPIVLAHGYVQLATDEDRLRIIATDGDTTVHASMAAAVSEQGSVTLSARALLPLLQGRKGDQVRLVLAGGALSVRGLSRRPYEFIPFVGTLAAAPPASSSDQDIDLSALHDAVVAVRHASSRDTGVAQLSASGGVLTLATTDSYRLAVARVEAAVTDLSEVVSLSALDTITRRSVTSMTALPTSRLLAFTGQDISWTTRPLGLPFPRIEAVLDSQPEENIEIDPTEALACLQRLSSVDPGGEQPVHLTLDDGMLAFTVSSSTGSGAEESSVSGSLDIVDVHLRRSFLADALAAHGRSPVHLAHAGGLQPVFLTSRTDRLTLLTVVMPVRA